jgi:hypothetical protein
VVCRDWRRESGQETGRRDDPYRGQAVERSAAALGVAHWSLHRWSEAARQPSRFHPVQVVAPVSAAPAPSLIIAVPTIGVRVEGLDVAAAAKLLVLLR